MRHQPGVGLAERVIQLPQHADPDLDILPLRLSHLPLGRRWKVAQIAILNTDQVLFSEREVQVEVNESVQRVRRFLGLFDDGCGAGQQSGADPDQQLNQ